MLSNWRTRLPSSVYAASGSYHYVTLVLSSRTAMIATHFQILCCTIPDVHSLEKWVVAVVECAPWSVELIGEDELLS